MISTRPTELFDGTFDGIYKNKYPRTLILMPSNLRLEDASGHHIKIASLLSGAFLCVPGGG
jgi:hypothetical protein